MCLYEHEQRHEDGAAAVRGTGHGGGGRCEYECWAGLGWARAGQLESGVSRDGGAF